MGSVKSTVASTRSLSGTGCTPVRNSSTSPSSMADGSPTPAGRVVKLSAGDGCPTLRASRPRSAQSRSSAAWAHVQRRFARPRERPARDTLRAQPRRQHRLPGQRQRADRPRVHPVVGHERRRHVGGAVDRAVPSRLASFSRLICFDKRGTGVSDPLPLAALPTLEQWSDDVRSVMQAAGSERAALFGHSQGGQMALLFAATWPGSTSALILADTTAHQYEDAALSQFSVGGRELSLDRLEETWGTAATLDILAPSAASDARFRRWYARYERLSLGPRMVRAVVACDFENDLRGVLSAVRVPTLVGKLRLLIYRLEEAKAV